MDDSQIDLDLFSGARGWEAASRDLVDAIGVELDETACATSLAAGFTTECADVTTLDPREFGPVRLLLGSPPCQTYSAAGNGAGRRALATVLQIVKAVGAGYWPVDMIESTGDPRTGLVVQPLRYALALRPESIAWEQVPAVLPVWEACADVLRGVGYSVTTGVLNAEQHGVPQTRRRAVLVASRISAVELPRPAHSRYYSHDPSRLDQGVAKWVSMAGALGWGATSRPAMTVTGGGTGTGGAEPFGNAARRGLLRERTAGRWIPREAVKNMGRGMVERYGTRPGRLIDEPAFTIRASAGGTEPGGFVWKFEDRLEKLTADEAATLQTFPDLYPFAGTKTARFQQIGNAVPPLLGRAIIAAALGVRLNPRATDPGFDFNQTAA